MRVPSPQSSAFQIHCKYLNVRDWGYAAGGTRSSRPLSPFVPLQLCNHYLETSPLEACWPRRREKYWFSRFSKLSVIFLAVIFLIKRWTVAKQIGCLPRGSTESLRTWRQEEVKHWHGPHFPWNQPNTSAGRSGKHGARSPLVTAEITGPESVEMLPPLSSDAWLKSVKVWRQRCVVGGGGGFIYKWKGFLRGRCVGYAVILGVAAGMDVCVVCVLAPVSRDHTVKHKPSPYCSGEDQMDALESQSPGSLTVWC